MPLVKRAVEPVFISRTTLDKNVKNELEGVVVNSLAGVIKQLSSISKHAENLFGELFNDANAIYERTFQLSQRVVMVHQQVLGLDASMKEDGKGWFFVDGVCGYGYSSRKMLAPTQPAQTASEIFTEL